MPSGDSYLYWRTGMPNTMCIVICMGSKGGLVSIPLHNFPFSIQSNLSTCPKDWRRYGIGRPIFTPNSVLHCFIRALLKADPQLESMISVPPVSGIDTPLTFWRWFQQLGLWWDRLQPAGWDVAKIKVIKHWNRSLVKIWNISHGSFRN